jgi:hypothetical protein
MDEGSGLTVEHATKSVRTGSVTQSGGLLIENLQFAFGGTDVCRKLSVGCDKNQSSGLDGRSVYNA